MNKRPPYTITSRISEITLPSKFRSHPEFILSIFEGRRPPCSLSCGGSSGRTDEEEKQKPVRGEEQAANASVSYHTNSFNKKVLLRADLNVPLKNNVIINDFKLSALQPTLNALQKNNANTLIVTHIGRPKDHDESLSTKHLITWFTQHNYDCVYASTIEKAHDLLSNHQFVLLENIRFWPEEKKQHKLFAQKLFARKLKGNTDIYVMDAFAVSHRSDTSITILPKLYEKNKRTIGLLVEHELQELNKLLINPQQPFNLILGGAKIETKLPLIKNLLPKTNAIALLPPLSSIFEKALGKEVGKSLVNESLISEARNILHETKKLENRIILNRIILSRIILRKILLPKDYLVASDWTDENSYAITDTIPSDKMALTIGPQTIQFYSEQLSSSKTIFFNGASGDIRYPKTCDAINALLQNICTTKAFKVGAGGDTVAMIQLCKKTTCFDFLSTGGGATLHYLSGQPLPGLAIFLKKPS